jgi:hypothetical protein
MNPSGAVLIVDDELRSRDSLQGVLSEEFDRTAMHLTPAAAARCRAARNREIRASSPIPLHLIVSRILTSVSRLLQLSLLQEG